MGRGVGEEVGGEEGQGGEVGLRAEVVTVAVSDSVLLGCNCTFFLCIVNIQKFGNTRVLFVKFRR